MSKKRDPIIHAAIIQAAASLASAVAINRGSGGFSASIRGFEDDFAEALELVEAKYDAHLAKHHEK